MSKASRTSTFSALADERYAERKYWESALSDGDLQAPAIVPVGAPGGVGKLVHLLSQSSSSDLMRISAGSQERLQVLLYGALLVLLRKYTGHADLMIGSPIYEQDDAEGDYINQMLCLRTVFSGEDNFQTLAGKCGKTIHEALRHQNYPYELVARFLNPSAGADLEVKAFFTVTLSLEGLHLARALDGLQVALGFHFLNTQNGLQLNLTYDAAKYGEPFVKQLANTYEAFLGQLLSDTARPLSELGLLSQPETAIAHGASKYYPNGRIDDWLEQSLEKYAERTAISMGDHSFTYAQLGDQSLSVARHLKIQGLQPGEMVGIRLTRSMEALVALVGVIRAGGVFIPLDNDLPKTRLQYIIEAARPRFLIVEEQMSELSTPQLTLKTLIHKPEVSEGALLTEKPKNSTCYTLFTSGTTGNAKGCMISHKSLVNYIQYVSETYLPELEQPACFGWFTTLSFDFTLTGIFGALTSGGQVRVYDQSLAVESIMSDLFNPKSAVNIVKLTPSHLSILKLLQLTETNVQVAICGGEALTTANIETLKGFSSPIKIFNEYGPTEATIGCIVSEINSEKSIPIGRPIFNAQAGIIDVDGHFLPDGIIGELVLSGEILMEGYLNGATSERLVKPQGLGSSKDFYKTGDLGYCQEGLFYYLGRADEEFKLRGYRIHPSEVTAALKTYEGVEGAHVIKVADDQGDVLVGYLAGNDDIDTDKVKGYLRALLPSYMMPDHLFVIDQFPLKPSGKIDVKSLPSFESWKSSGANYKAARNDVEQQLVDMWEEVLGREQVGIFDNFFLIGGHSLHATRVITRIKRDFIDTIDFRALYKYPNIASMAEHLQRLIDQNEVGQGDETLRLEALEDQADYPLSHAQRRLWVIDQLDSTGAGYISSGFYRIDGPVDTNALTSAFHQLVDRHEILRTRFVKKDGEPRQEVLSRAAIGFAVHNHELTPGDVSLAVLEQSLYRPFVLAEGPALRVVLATESEQLSYLGISFHHIVCDGWSMNVILKELKALYLSVVEGKPATLPPLSVQYRDFAVWEEALLQKESDELRAFWQSHLAGYQVASELPLDYPRPENRTFSGGLVEASLDETALASLAKKHGVSVYAIVMSSVKVLVHYLTGSEDITIGTAVTGRDQVVLEEQIGLYVNTLPVRSLINPDLSFETFIKDEHERLLDVLARQHYPFDKILDDLRYETLPNRNPLFDVGFTFNPEDQGHGEKERALDKETTIGILEKSAFTVKSDLWFHAFRSNDELILEAEFNIDLYKKARVQRYTDLLVHILKSTDWSLNINEMQAELEKAEKHKRKSTLKSLANKNLKRLTQ